MAARSSVKNRLEKHRQKADKDPKVAATKADEANAQDLDKPPEDGQEEGESGQADDEIGTSRDESVAESGQADQQKPPEVVLQGKAEEPPPYFDQPGFKVSTIQVPLGEIDLNANDRPAHLDVQLNREQSRALRRLANGCHQKHVKLKTGRHVESKPDAIKWLLENLVSQME